MPAYCSISSADFAGSHFILVPKRLSLMRHPFQIVQVHKASIDYRIGEDFMSIE